MKRPFSMIEIMIALAIIAILGPVLFENPTKAFQQNIVSLKKTEALRVAKKTAVELQHAFANTVQWKELSLEWVTRPLNPVTINLPGVGAFALQREYAFRTVKEKSGSAGGKPIRLVQCQVCIDGTPNLYSFLLIVEKQDQLKI